MTSGVEIEVHSVTWETAKDLEPGDVLEVGRLFSGMSREPLVYTVASVDVKRRVVRYQLSWHGVVMGMLGAKYNGKAVTWVEESWHV